MSWKCKCGFVMSGLMNYCTGSKYPERFGNVHYQVTPNKPDFLQAIVAGKGLDVTPQEELFAKFYNHEKILVKDMDLVQLREHRESLSTVAFEAKARLVAADDEGKERRAKTNNKEWLVTTDNEVVTSDAINAVKVRSARMSKMDKLREQLLAAGIDGELANEMVRNLESKATEKNVKAITFKSDKVKTAPVVIIVKPIEETKPFNPTSLSFLRKE